ncbi:hypothetical protein KI387_027893, partial [Taxus chinensis]
VYSTEPFSFQDCDLNGSVRYSVAKSFLFSTMATAFFGALMEFHTPYGRTPLRETQRQELEQGQRWPLGNWLMHYSSLHRILLVGEGDFSFSSALATKFGHADNIVSTSLDSR